MSQFTFGLKAGFNMNNVKLNLDNNSEEVDVDFSFGLHAGGVLDYNINKNLSVQTGLTYVNKGYSFNFDDFNLKGEKVNRKYVASYNYFQIPINFVFKFDVGLQAYMGPYIAFGTGGREKFTVTVETDSNSYKGGLEYNLKPVIGEVKSGDLREDDQAFNGFAYGFNFAMGYAKGSAAINFVYSVGLSNVVANYSNRNDEIYNRTASLSFTYLINKK